MEPGKILAIKIKRLLISILSRSSWGAQTCQYILQVAIPSLLKHFDGNENKHSTETIYLLLFIVVYSILSYQYRIRLTMISTH